MIQHDLDDALNELAPPIIVAGLQVDTWCTWHDEQSPWPLDEFAGVVSMGALASVTNETSVPWIRSELELLSRALERGVPILGVCFGSQSLARAAGVRSVNRP